MIVGKAQKIIKIKDSKRFDTGCYARLSVVSKKIMIMMDLNKS